MPSTPKLRAADAETLLISAGFAYVEHRGKHRLYQKGRVRVVVPFDGRAELHPKAVRSVVDAIERARPAPKVVERIPPREAPPAPPPPPAPELQPFVDDFVTPAVAGEMEPEPEHPPAPPSAVPAPADPPASPAPTDPPQTPRRKVKGAWS